MKVLHILDSSLPKVSGYASRSDAIIRNQRVLKIDTCHLTSQKYTAFDHLCEDVNGMKYYRTEDKPSLLGQLPLIGYLDHVWHLAKRIEEVVKIEKPDVLHAHSPMLNGLAALLVRKRLGIPVVYEVRAFWEDAAVDTGKTKEGSFKYKLIKGLEQYVFKHVNKVACICEGLREAITARGIPQEKLFVSPNAVDFKKFTPLKDKEPGLLRELSLDDKKVIGFLGSFFKYEGLEFAVKAMPKILKSIPNAHLLLVGGGNQDEALRKLVNEMNLNANVTFTGRVPYQDISNYYSLVDVLLFPRENIRLTQLVTPLKPLESMALGKPVIASDVGGHKEMVEHLKTGMLFKAEDIDSLAESVITLISDEALISKCVANGHEYVQNVRNWENTARCYLPVYEEITKHA